MREIVHHKRDGLNNLLRVEATDDDKPGESNKKYELFILRDNMFQKVVRLEFQNGEHIPTLINPIARVNGITDDSLLCVLIDRFECIKDKSEQVKPVITALRKALTLIGKI